MRVVDNFVAAAAAFAVLPLCGSMMQLQLQLQSMMTMTLIKYSEPCLDVIGSVVENWNEYWIALVWHEIYMKNDLLSILQILKIICLCLPMLPMACIKPKWQARRAAADRQLQHWIACLLNFNSAQHLNNWINIWITE